MGMAGKNGDDGKTSNDNEIRGCHSVRHSRRPVRYARCPLSVIPDVFNRESSIFPRPGYTNEGTKEKDSGFPLNPCGNDRGDLRE